MYDHGAYPTVQEQRPFLEAYARARLGAERRVQPSDVDSAEVSALVDALAAEASAAAPLAHCVWGLWALCALPAAVAAAGGGCDGSCGFSHIEYAERRLGAFFASFEATPLFEEELNLIYDSKCAVCRWEVQSARDMSRAPADIWPCPRHPPPVILTRAVRLRPALTRRRGEDPLHRPRRWPPPACTLLRPTYPTARADCG